MPMFKSFTEIRSCCCCIPDLKAATAIIAVIGLVSSPAVSWTIVRHSYSIRVACFITTSSERVDVMDLTLNNIISFGFGVNAGLGPSCMSYSTTEKTVKQLKHAVTTDPMSSEFVKTIRYFGWVVLVADIFFAVVCLTMLYAVFREPSYRHITTFMVMAFIAVLMSCIYGMLYIASCISLGGALPLFELFFTFFDLCLWIYFMMVVKAFRAGKAGQSAT